MAVRIYEGERYSFGTTTHLLTYNVDFQLFDNYVYTLDKYWYNQRISRFSNDFSTYNALQNFDRRDDPASPTCLLKVPNYMLVGFSGGKIKNLQDSASTFMAFENDWVARMFLVGISAVNKNLLAQSSSGQLCYFNVYSDGEMRMWTRHDVTWFFDGGNAVNHSSRITDAMAIDNMHHVLLVEDKLALVKWQDLLFTNKRGSSNLPARGLAITKDSNGDLLCALQNGYIQRYRVTDEEEGLQYVSTMRTDLPDIINACFVNANKVVFLQKLDDSYLVFSVFDFSNNILGQHVINVPNAPLGFNVEFKGAQSQNMFYLKLRLRFPDETICRLEQFLIEAVAAGGSAPERGQKRDAPETSAHRVKEKIMRLMKDLSREQRESLINDLQKEQCSVCMTDYNRTEEGDKEDITPVFGECGHTVCTDCEPKLPAPKKCPSCRTRWRPAEFALLLI